MASNPARLEDEARLRAQFILGGVSLVIWLLVAFSLSVAWFVDEYTARPIFVAGVVAFVVAALPWVAYRALTRRLRRP
jgi:uncharacterized membrane protein